MDFYKILNLKKDASQDDIKKAYRKLAMKYHPDRNQNDKKAEEKFKEIQKAYETLGDPKKRAEYDYDHNTNYRNKKTQAYESHSGDFFKENFSDIFDDHFSSFFKQREYIQQIALPINFWEAIKGTTKIFQINFDDNGTIKTYEVKLKIPSGSDSGDSFIININEEKIQIILDVSQDTNFQRNNLDLFLKVDIPFNLALIGGKVIFPHWDGDLEVSLPPGLNNGNQVLLANKGIQKGFFRGDLYLVVNVTIPKNLTDEQKNIIQQFSDTEKTKKTWFESIKKNLSKFF